MFGIGAGEFVVILIVGLIVFGPGKLPEVGRALGKALREFRKAQAALSATLNESVEEKKSEPQPAPEKIPATQNVTADEVINLAKERSLVKESSNEKISNGTSDDAPVVDARASVAGAGHSDKPPATNKPAVTADEVINLAKERSLVKESSNEKISNDTSNDAPVVDVRASVAGAGRSSNGSDKQP